MSLRTFTYPAIFEAGDVAGITVTFPDVPGAITQGDDEADARAMATDALGVALLTTVGAKRPLPAPSPVRSGQISITVDADVAAKLAVIEAFQEAGISQRELAKRLGKDEREARRILDPEHPTKMLALAAALAVLGRRLVIGVEAA